MLLEVIRVAANKIGRFVVVRGYIVSMGKTAKMPGSGIFLASSSMRNCYRHFLRSLRGSLKQAHVPCAPDLFKLEPRHTCLERLVQLLKRGLIQFHNSPEPL